jgi:anti-sigma factor RsiW
MASDPEITDEELADLARLVDGTLPGERRAEVEARVAASPELARMVERQRTSLDAVRGTADIGAPARLRADIERRRAGRPAKRRRSWAPYRGAIAAVAATALALALVLPGGGPTVADAAALAQRPPTQAAPAAEPGTPQLLRAQVDDVPFPNYDAKFGWKAAGAREDDPDGRAARTVYYGKGGRTMAYTIVSGDALEYPADASKTKRGGVDYRSFSDDGRTVVTWERNGHTCVLSSDSAPAAELVELADWRGKGAIPF